MGGPFAGGAMTGGATSTNRGSGALPPDHPPVGGATGGNRAAAAPSASGLAPLPKYAVPDTWKEEAASGIRRIVLSIPKGDRQALVTVFDFSANSAPLIADPLENVNRWRREVGLPDVAAGDESIKPIEISGQPATYVALIPPESQPDQPGTATLGAMVTIGGRIWFFKLTGDRELVAGEQERFQQFLGSLQFTPAGGASDGDR
jgi:hypothetical protein